MSVSTRVAVVTGSNKGIGLQTVKELCRKFDGAVFLTSRDENRGKAAVEECNKLGLKPLYHQLDVEDESSVLRLRDHLKDTYGGLDVLVNNGAILLPFRDGSTPELFAEHALKTISTNYFGLSRVCNILFPLLRPHARVVNLTSMLGHLSRIDGKDEAAAKLRAKLSSDDLTQEELDNLMQNFVDSAKRGDHVKYGWPEMSHYTTYNVSKVGVSALSRIQHRQFSSDSRPDIIVNHVHPGWVDTDMSEHLGPLTVEQGAVAPTWCALLPPNVEGPKGCYVWCDKTIVDWVNGPMPAPL